ncbi:MAG: diacylglycerol kinase family protein [Candidatus Korobacteraceae bacterium]
MRAVALLGLHAKEHHVRRFEMPGVNLFSGNELDPTDQPDAALVFGGDGTIHRHLGGLARKQIPTLIVPVGSANDFAQSIGVESVSKSLAAWQRFCSSGDNVRSIDLGTIEPLEPNSPAPRPPSLANSEDVELKSGSSNETLNANDAVPWQGETLESLHFVPDGPRLDLPRMGTRIMHSQLRRRSEAGNQIASTTFFCCLAGTGLDAAVNRLTLAQPRWLRGHGGYVVGLVQVLSTFQPPHVTVSVEEAGSWQTRVDEPGFLIAAGNGPQYGHGMRLTHEAKMDDGLFDVCFVKTLSKLRLLWLFRAVYSGGHIHMKEVEYFRASRLRIATDPVTEIFADGEYICETPAELSVRRDGLRVIVS